MNTTRHFWTKSLIKITAPVLNALANGTLVKDFPIKHHPDSLDRRDYTYLEVLGRTLCGMAPWLETPALDSSEERLRLHHAQLARQAITQAVTPHSPDYVNFAKGFQPIVDAAFLAQAILRAPTELYAKLDSQTRQHLISGMKQTRSRKPGANNWLLFSAIIEVFLRFAGEADWDPMRIDYALKQHMQWYKGDGFYGDGAHFHFDYYNSFVINPMLYDVIHAVKSEYDDWQKLSSVIDRRASHYAGTLEQLIMSDGSYPVFGRSSCYRFGAFHALAQAALCNNLPSDLSDAQVRCALTAVIQRVMSYPDMFDESGWLNIGVCSEQPSMGETYISTGSLYLCTFVFLPLGLPESHPFWSSSDAAWTQKRIWNGENTIAKHSLYEYN